MNYRPLATKCWEKFLNSKGFVAKRKKGSHYQFIKPGKRTIPVWLDEKEIPAFHLKTSCRTIGITLEELYKWVDENC
jgi:predicted RNA binding protein YcfA (HicA-like mRNA interferase family)